MINIAANTPLPTAWSIPTRASYRLHSANSSCTASARLALDPKPSNLYDSRRLVLQIRSILIDTAFSWAAVAGESTWPTIVPSVKRLMPPSLSMNTFTCPICSQPRPDEPHLDWCTYEGPEPEPED